MNKRLLESKMILFGDSSSTLAKALDITVQSFYAKKNETKGKNFTQREIREIIKRYDLSPQEINDIFFAEKLS